MPPSKGLFGVPGLLPHGRGHGEPAAAPVAQESTAEAHVDQEAQFRAHQRHMDESNLTAIHGHIASIDRRNQGKRDRRGD